MCVSIQIKKCSFYYCEQLCGDYVDVNSIENVMHRNNADLQ
jgi:hypothetical protein